MQRIMWLLLLTVASLLDIDFRIKRYVKRISVTIRNSISQKRYNVKRPNVKNDQGSTLSFKEPSLRPPLSADISIAKTKSGSDLSTTVVSIDSIPVFTMKETKIGFDDKFIRVTVTPSGNNFC